LSDQQRLGDHSFFKQTVVASASDRYDKAVAKWESASPEDKQAFKQILDNAKDLLDAANQNLLAFMNRPKQKLPSTGVNLATC
jgi:delta 1-pyrroline-5-carboxylate dehydrogenase